MFRKNFWFSEWFIFCSPCEKPLNKDLVPNTIFSQAKNVEGTPTFKRWQRYKEQLKIQANPLIETERQVEAERKAKMKRELEKLGF